MYNYKEGKVVSNHAPSLSMFFYFLLRMSPYGVTFYVSVLKSYSDVGNVIWWQEGIYFCGTGKLY
jgi:hypothetical protein